MTLARFEGQSLSERKQASVREAICTCATDLFVEHGFQETTIEQIARAAGIGRRTFFRYFKSKEDVVLWKFDQFARLSLELLAQRPAREQQLSALESALTEASEFYNRQPEQTLAILRLTEGTPSLFAQQLLQQQNWKEWFTAALRTRSRAASSSYTPELAASVAIESMAIAVRRWLHDGRGELTSHIAASFAALRRVLE
jgi:AcrR family transcriptional regulator